jgi:hypothetical protein
MSQMRRRYERLAEEHPRAFGSAMDEAYEQGYAWGTDEWFRYVVDLGESIVDAGEEER